MNFQIIKIDGFHKIILRKPGFFMTLEFGDIGIQPDGFAQIEPITDFIQGGKDFVRTGLFTVIFNYNVRNHMIIAKNFTPKPEHEKALPVTFV